MTQPPVGDLHAPATDDLLLCAIDPGNVESAYVTVGPDYRPTKFGKVPNSELLLFLEEHWAAAPSIDHAGVPRHLAIEQVAAMGMAVGETVFETVHWAGRFHQAFARRGNDRIHRVKRVPIKIHHCGQARAKDTNIRQALVDRFAPGRSNSGKGTKAAPGFFYGFRADVWQAYALAVYVMDRLLAGEKP